MVGHRALSPTAPLEAAWEGGTTAKKGRGHHKGEAESQQGRGRPQQNGRGPRKEEVESFFFLHLGLGRDSRDQPRGGFALVFVWFYVPPFFCQVCLNGIVLSTVILDSISHLLPSLTTLSGLATVHF